MLTVDFDPTNIFFRRNNNRLAATVPAWTGDRTIRMSITSSIPDAGPNITSFIGTEMDIFSAEGIPAERWTNFPTGQQP